MHDFGGWNRAFDGLRDSTSIWARFKSIANAEFGVTHALWGISHSFTRALESGFTAAIESWSDYPEDYLGVLSSKGLLDHDYSTRYIIENRRPYFWMSGKGIADMTAKERERDILDEMFSLKVGVSLPMVFGHNHGSGVGLATGGLTAPELDEIWHLKGDALTGLCMAFDAAMRQFAPPERFDLTKRERDVLSFAASGMNALQIATHLDLSNRTVEGALDRARRTLKSANTTEAVAKAIVFGLI
ncbi:MAG: autoinducer binding domain-containing protein [Phyllobacteriaceae bacterium]|nr:autoinducer binding domain-containing protein [Phyllobacteriaceae bacterium]